MFIVEIETETGRVGMMFPDLESPGDIRGEFWDDRRTSDRIVLRFHSAEEVGSRFRSLVKEIGFFDRLTCHIADSFLNIVRNNPAELTAAPNLTYNVIHVDAHAGAVDVATFTFEQAVALVALGIGGDEIFGSEQYYALLHPIIAGWKTRPIP